MDLDKLWGETPRPANVRACPPEQSGKIPLALTMLLVENAPEHVRTWSQWAEQQNIPCYLSAAA
jgi:hypothetical protein